MEPRQKSTVVIEIVDTSQNVPYVHIRVSRYLLPKFQKLIDSAFAAQDERVEWSYKKF